MFTPRRWRLRPVLVVVVSLLLLAAIVAACVTAAASLQPSASASATGTQTGTPNPTASASPTASPTPQPTPEPSLLHRRVTVLILGSDSTPDRIAQGLGRLTDSIIVASIDASHKQLSMISFPRDITDIPMGDGRTWRQKINSIPYYTNETVMKRAIAATLNQPIDYYVEVNMVDFAALVDAIGGIDVYVPRAIDDRSIQLRIPAGPHHMIGAVALKYSRSRHTTSDYDRAARQQQVLLAIVRKMVNPATKIDFLGLIGALRSLRTDLPLGQFATFFELARRSASAKLVSRVLAPPTFGYSRLEAVRGYIEEPNIGAIRSYAASVMGR